MALARLFETSSQNCEKARQWRAFYVRRHPETEISPHLGREALHILSFDSGIRSRHLHGGGAVVAILTVGGSLAGWLIARSRFVRRTGEVSIASADLDWATMFLTAAASPDRIR